jgi:tRNA modification GTPase
VDDAVAGLFLSPRSYTGDDVVELSCHGGAALVRRVLDLCLARGARTAGPGEFTRRAFLNGKIDLAQAEAVADLVAARSEDFRRLALEQLQGGLSRQLRSWRDDALALLADIEASLDFVDDEIPPVDASAAEARRENLAARLRRLVDTASRGRIARDGWRVAIAGRPNVGKSSLFNALLGVDRAIVTDQPGTTRDLLEESRPGSGTTLVFTDTAGLRETEHLVEGEGIRRARAAMERADLVLWVVDASRNPEEADLTAARDAAASGRPLIVALNKRDVWREPVDVVTENWRRNLPIESTAWRAVSARTGEGLDALLRALDPARLVPTSGGDGSPSILVNARHEELLRSAIGALDNVRSAGPAAGLEECLAGDLRRALEAVGHILGEGVSEAVLDAIFARFCVGK